MSARSASASQFDVTADGTLSWVEVECLGACVNAPMAQINYDFYEDLTPESLTRILDDLAAGKHAEARPADRPAILRAARRADTLLEPALRPSAPHRGLR